MHTITNQSRTAGRAASAQKIIRRRTLYAAGAGLIPLPVVDAAAIIGIQLLMIRDLSRVYETPFRETRVRALITTLVGDVATVSVTKLLPGFGSVLSGLTASVAGAASTYALGRVFSQHFAQGGTLLSFDPEASRAFYRSEFEQGIEVVRGLQPAAEDAAADKKALLAALTDLRLVLRQQAAGAGPDLSNLELIEGIGPKIAEALRAAGIVDLRSLAAAEASQLQAILDSAGGNFSLSVPDSWPEQARLAVAGDMDGLQKLQASLTGGRADKGTKKK